MTIDEEVAADYATGGLSLKSHPVALIRDQLAGQGVITARQLAATPHGRRVSVAGLVLIRQRPGTASGIVFETLEDETGVVNLIIHPSTYERYRVAARYASLLRADGRVERNGPVVHVLAERMYDLRDLQIAPAGKSRDFH